MTNQNTEKQVKDLIKRSSKILILPSAPIDGDSIGSAIAFYLLLKKLGKEPTVICSEPVPDVLKFLPDTDSIQTKNGNPKDFIITIDADNLKPENIETTFQNGKVNIIISAEGTKLDPDQIKFNQSKSDYDLIITVDTADLSQLRDFYEQNTELFTQLPVINIDHHISNENFGKINLVDIMASATTELLLPLFESIQQEVGKPLIDEDIATLLLTGIITDTGSFQNANTTPQSFAKAAELIAYGARQQEIIQHIYKTKQLSQLKLWGRVLSKIQTDDKHRIVWSAVSQQDFRDTHSTEEQTGDIIDELMTNAPGAEVILLLKEKSDHSISVSIRTTNDAIDASQIAEHFGGGGHPRAAGCTLKDLDLTDAQFQILQKVRQYQSERLGLHTPESAENGEKNEKNEPTKNSEKPLIDVPKLMERAAQAEKATEMISKVSEEKPTPTPEPAEKQTEEKSTPKPSEPAEKPTPKTPKSTKTTTEEPSTKKSPVTPTTVYKFED